MFIKPKHEVTVSFNRGTERKTKTFTDTYAARRFYTSEFKKGNEPKIESAIDKSL